MRSEESGLGGAGLTQGLAISAFILTPSQAAASSRGEKGATAPLRERAPLIKQENAFSLPRNDFIKPQTSSLDDSLNNFS